MIVLDASVMIAHMLHGNAHADAAFEILETEEELFIHPLTVAESFVGPARRGRISDAERAIRTLGIEQIVPPPSEPAVLAQLRALTSLKLPDCCVLATAESLGAALATFDRHLADVARARGIVVRGA